MEINNTKTRHESLTHSTSVHQYRRDEYLEIKLPFRSLTYFREFLLQDDNKLTSSRSQKSN